MKVSLYGLFPPKIGGVSIHLYRLAKYLLKDNYLESVYVNNMGLMNASYPSFCRDVSIRYRWDILSRIKWLVSVMKEDYSDLFHLHGSLFWDYILVLLLVRKYHRKVIFTIHDQMQLQKNNYALVALKLLYRLIPQNYLFFIAVNPNIARQLQKIGISQSRIKIIPAFLCESNDTPLNIEFQSLSTDYVNILLYAPALKSKSDFLIYGIEIGLESYYNLLLKEKYRLRLILCVPNGIDNSLYSAMIQNFKLNNDNYLLFDRPISNIGKLLSLVDIYLRPTTSDGDSVFLREAISYGCLTLASDIIERPKTTSIFETNNVNDCTSKLEYLIENAKELRLRQSTNDFYKDIISVYKYVDNEDISYFK